MWSVLGWERCRPLIWSPYYSGSFIEVKLLMRFSPTKSHLVLTVHRTAGVVVLTGCNDTVDRCLTYVLGYVSGTVELELVMYLSDKHSIPAVLLNQSHQQHRSLLHHDGAGPLQQVVEGSMLVTKTYAAAVECRQHTTLSESIYLLR